MQYRAELMCPHPVARLAAVVLNVAAVPAWNDALSAVHTTDTVARLGVRYPATVKRLVRAWIEYDEISPTRIEYRLGAAGNLERGVWIFTEHLDGRTRAAHEMQHSGPVLTLMRDAFAPVAALRLARLNERAASVAG